MLIDVNLKVKIQKNNSTIKTFVETSLNPKMALTRFQNLSVDDFEHDNK